MAEDIIKTGVDKLVSYLEGRDRVLLSDAAVALGLDGETLQSWVDFLVEESIVGIEYKFTKPYIYLNKEEHKKAKILGEEELSWDSFHRAFLDRAREKQIPDMKAASLWKQHVLGLLDKKAPFFYDEARKRGMTRIDDLWKEYRTEVLLKI